MTLTDVEAEAIRVFYCLSTRESMRSTAETFGCHQNSVREIVHGRTHVGRQRGNRTPGPRPRFFMSVGREKRKTIFGLLQSGPKDINEIKHAIGGTNPSKYLTELREAGKVELKHMWVLK